MFNTLFFFFLEFENIYKDLRLQNSPYFCVFKYARAVKQKVWNCKQAVFYKAKLLVRIFNSRKKLLCLVAQYNVDPTILNLVRLFTNVN